MMVGVVGVAWVMEMSGEAGRVSESCSTVLTVRPEITHSTHSLWVDTQLRAVIRSGWMSAYIGIHTHAHTRTYTRTHKD